ncbi:MAG: three-Cys-motif partner protein TcmP [Paracoccaceae bacterium]
MRKSHREKTVGPWARQKLDGLEAYLHHYTLALKKQRFDLVFIDAFAGAGISKIRDAWQGIDDDDILLLDDEFLEGRSQFIQGSPHRALGLQHGFSRHYFFDADPSRAELLEKLHQQYPNRKIINQHGDANYLIQKLGRSLHGTGTKGVAFLDPYGPHLHWETIEALADTKNFEVIINFPLGMAINRLIKKDGDIPESWRTSLNQCFGRTQWETISYSEQPDLFGDLNRQKIDNAGDALLGYYVARLKSKFRYVTTPSVVRNTKGAPIYYLIWAGPHSLGYKIAKHIMNLGDRVKPPK